MTSTSPNATRDACNFTEATTIDSLAALMDLIHRCAAQHISLVDYGRAHQGLGHPPRTPHIHLAQQPFRTDAIDHYIRDFTVRVAAGVPLGQLQAALQQHGQFLPIDADADLSVGECIAHNVYGPLRAGYGSLRDLLLGLHYLDGQGQDIHVGGRTVKNVAGLDVTKLMVGNLGELGVIHQATLRTYAIPATVLAVELTVGHPATLDPLITRWLLSDAAPARMELSRSKTPDGWVLHLGYFGRLEAGQAQLDALTELLRNESGFHVTAQTAHSLTEDTTQQAARRTWRRQANTLVKIVVPPAHTGAVGKILADAYGDSLSIDALPGHGCIFAGGDMDAPAALRLEQTLTEVIQPLGGFRVWHQRPAGTQDAIAPFAPPQPDWAMLRKLKRALDPGNIFNPGRFLHDEAYA